MIGLVRVRLGLLAVAFVVLGAAACGVFDTIDWALIVTPTLPIALVGVVVRRGPWTRTAAALIGIVSAALICAVSVGGDLADFAAAFTAGPQRLLSTEWPSPNRGDLVGTVGVWLAVTAALSALLTTWRRWHLLPLLPMIVAYVGIVALSSPLGVRPLVLVVLCAISVVFATLRVDGPISERWLLLRGERRLIGLMAVVAVLAFAISVPIAFADRADPRRDEPAEDTAALLDPIEATIALRALDPPIELHEITATDGSSTLPPRWRTAVLEEYDGRRWTPLVTLRPIGNTLGPVTGPTVAADVTFLDDDLSLVPFPGSPVSVDTSVETDRARTVVRLVERPDPGDSVSIVSNITGTLGSVAPGAGVVARPVDETVAGLTGLAELLADAGPGSDTTLLSQLANIERTMRDDFVLDSAVTGGGLQRALIDRFLRDTQRGNTEQFATAFVLLARSLGVDARVATGFVVEQPTTGSLDLTSADAVIWPEVAFTDGTWVAFDPVPAEEATDTTPPEPQPQVQTPAAPQPPIDPPPEPTDQNVETETETTETDAGTLSTAALWARRVSVAATIFLLPLAIAVGLVLGIKLRRRRRRRKAAEPSDRIRGAWASATDGLVDAGLSIPFSLTDDEIARRGDPMAPTARRELRRLAVLNSAATYGSPNRPDLLAQDALQCLDAIDAAIKAPKSRWQRIRWRLSLRSLRSTTRSPVTS